MPNEWEADAPSAHLCNLQQMLLGALQAATSAAQNVQLAQADMRKHSAGGGGCKVEGVRSCDAPAAWQCGRTYTHMPALVLQDMVCILALWSSCIRQPTAKVAGRPHLSRICTYLMHMSGGMKGHAVSTVSVSVSSPATCNAQQHPHVQVCSRLTSCAEGRSACPYMHVELTGVQHCQAASTD